MKLSTLLFSVFLAMNGMFTSPENTPPPGGKPLPVYDGDDLGLTYSAKKSTFKIWSPDASEVTLRLYAAGEGGNPVLTKKMKKSKTGVWSAKLKGNLDGKYYTFQVSVGGKILPETPDPYAISTGVNGKRAQVVDLKKTNPIGWDADARPALKNHADIILYELHVRDVSIHPASGVKKKGKFLGLSETKTKTPGGKTTGIEHLKELGVTHVHLLPSFDFRSIDESKLSEKEYNWGYDPENFNVPEGSYATKQADGRVRIREFKTMVKALHDNGLRVVMDVVYNHTGATDESVFNRIAPGHYYRKNADGTWSNASGCGNETASEQPMMRKFMLESMLFWAREYHVDGFRVDLMGIHDIETMNLIASELRKIDPSIFIYGEGWTAGGSPLPEELRAVKANVSKLDGIAAFSDEFRDGVKGHVFHPEERGFASGFEGLEESVKFGIAGAVEHPQVDVTKVNYTQKFWAKQPTQCINYVSCHDNHTLWDRLKNSCPDEPESELMKMAKLSQTIVFTSQGVPFLHAGEEFIRTKKGVENSFESPDDVNQIDWLNKEKYTEFYNYHKDLIRLRKSHPAFRMGNADLVRKHLQFLSIPEKNVIGYLLKDNANGDPWKNILVIFNGNKQEKTVPIPAGKWKMVLWEGRFSEKGMGSFKETALPVPGRSAVIFMEE